ncbi:MAG: hypothetical protein VKJ27_01950 [Synechocystis sp.]|nr:hypothetical protein [Synechocystis sp.]
MFPDLFTATQTYWRKLDQIEADYQQGKLSIQEVDQQVKTLMNELGAQRRAAFSSVWQGSRRWINQNQEWLLGLVSVVIAIYLWLMWLPTLAS